jgi:hypothetical protein
VSQANPFTPPTGVTFTAAVAQDNWTYDTNSKALLKTGASMTGEHCTVDYKVTDSSTMPTVTSDGWNTDIPTASDAGNYYVWTRVTCSGTPDNYVDAVYQTPAEVAVAKATPTATVTGRSSLTYTGIAQDLVTCSNVTATCTVKYYVAGDPSAAPTTETVWATTAQGTKAGPYYVWYKIVGNDNYIDVVSTSYINVEIDKATLTAKADDKERAYNTANPPFTVTVTGFVNGETATTAAGYVAPTASCSASLDSPVGEHDITVSGGNPGNNYVFTYVNGKLTITAATPSFSIDPTSLTFASADAVNSTKTITVTRDGDGVISASVGTATNISVSVEGNTVTVTRQSADAGSANVTVSVAAGTSYSAPADKVCTVTLEAAPVITAVPTAKTLKYSTSAQDIIEAGTVTNGTMYYKAVTKHVGDSDYQAVAEVTSFTYTDLTDAGWSTSVPQTAGGSDDAGTKYKVYYLVVGDAGYSNIYSTSSMVVGEIEMLKADLTSPGYTGSGTIAAKTGLTAGTDHYLITVSVTNSDIPSGSELQYSLGTAAAAGDSDSWSTTIPQGNAAGTYYVWYRITESANYNQYNHPTPIEVTIGSGS